MRSNSSTAATGRASGDVWIVVGVVAALIFFLISGAVSFYNIKVLQSDQQRVTHTHDVILALDELLSAIQDTETGQRGFLLTGADRYLEPYNAAVAAVASRTDAIATLTRDNPDQQANLVQLKSHIDAKLAELKETIDLRREQGAAAALAVVQSDRGKAQMDAIRAQQVVMKQMEVDLRVGRLAEMQVAYRTAWLSGILSTALGIALTLIIGFQPVAEQKQLALEITIAKDAPPSVTTDRQRLEQILRNLLSNAFKFTEKGGVSLSIAPVEGGLALAVSDSGIGVSEEQHQAIFEAFRQADGTISRRFGGTGLGLSISRELSRLLGGTIALSSTPGEGATFTVTIPLAFDAERVALRVEPAADIASHIPSAPVVRLRPALTQPMADDRDELDSARRLLLVIEDDAIFAGIVRDLAHELGFQCVIADTAEQAIEAARAFRPNAVVLDVGLPDQSGLTVLDRLKRSDETRHIPIHVVSAADHSQTALSLGAVGYLVKPV